MTNESNLSIDLDVRGKRSIELNVQGFEGTECISLPFSYVIYATTSSDVDTSSLIGERATLSVKTACGRWLASGLCAQIEELDPTVTDLRVLQFVLRPRFAVAELSVASRIYGPDQPVGVEDIIKLQLGKVSIAIPSEYNLDRYPKRNYIVQYNESDLTFISRLCERNGIFYFFKQEEDGETVVFGDKNLAFPNVKFGDKSRILYARAHERQAPRSVDESAVRSFRQRRVLSTKTIAFRDYNETVPSVVSVDQQVGQGSGFVGKASRFGGHFANEAEATALARIRVEQICAGQTMYIAHSDAPELRAGVIFELEGHPRFDGKYLVIAADHSAYCPAPTGFHAAMQNGRAYQNMVHCIRSDVPYRPVAMTPVPLGVGLHTATVDGEAWNGRAEIDDQGRYRLQFTFAEELAKGAGSDYVRKLEPYVGPNQTGLHCPLVPGTEVMVGYLNGDIDRPVVIGAVHNPDMKGGVTSDTHLFNRLKSQSGASIEIYDGPASPSGAL
ncbi:type VI secretion system tip protein VgrG [Bradyrhizobium sp. Arg62]|uniref:type VI secretion system Vgr family protein n=1 Tax=Bradyrhizobium TaxID=374 RepID=UPI001E28EF5B|nr:MULTISPECIES: type VI secretion system tip protein TssI/VgrG [Bradyrhizobium]MCC8941814.1 type VI secretion system tip protein VgrG [Bradyrhizobium ivorense]MCC8950963.1 type VI secretion system tip protein VgrG [Bradyrhizobium brasilense]